MNRQRAVQWLVLIAITISCLSLAGVKTGYSKATDNQDPEATEIVVKLNPVNSPTIQAINATYGTTTRSALVNSSGIYRLQVPSGALASELAKEMADDARLLYAEPNFQNEVPEGNPRHISEWGGPDSLSPTPDFATAMLGLAQAHALRRGAGITVAVLDTGIQLDHPDLVNRLTTARYDFVDDDAIPADEGNNQDDDGDGLTDEAFGHGTHVAGIIHRVAPDAQIMPLRVLDAEGRGNIFVIAEAMLYAAQHGAQVINLSLGTSQESELMKDILEDLAQTYDVMIVAAAGNLNSTVKQFPAAEDEVLSVTSIDGASKKSAFANYGDWIDVAAPGEGISSTFPVNIYAMWSGTSMAVPFVAGQAALIRSAAPAMTVPYIMAHIRESAQSIDAGNPGYQGKLGRGRIDVSGSLQTMCDQDGACHAPDLTGKVTLATDAIVNSRPSPNLQGAWIIGGVTYIADGNTEFREDKGPLQVGGCAGVDYVNTIPFSALRIRSRESYECAQATPIPPPTTSATPTATGQQRPSPTMTITPIAAVTVTATPTQRPANTVTATTATATSTATSVPTPTPVQATNEVIHGRITSIPVGGKEGIWIIDGVAYLVTATTVLTGQLTEGNIVAVQSFAASDGSRVAMRIEEIVMNEKVYLPFVSK